MFAHQTHAVAPSRSTFILAVRVLAGSTMKWKHCIIFAVVTGLQGNSQVTYYCGGKWESSVCFIHLLITHAELIRHWRRFAVTNVTADYRWVCCCREVFILLSNCFFRVMINGVIKGCSCDQKSQNQELQRAWASLNGTASVHSFPSLCGSVSAILSTTILIWFPCRLIANHIWTRTKL